MSHMTLAQTIQLDHNTDGHVGDKGGGFLEVLSSPPVQEENETTPRLDGSWKCSGCGTSPVALVQINSTSKPDRGCNVWCPIYRVYVSPCINPPYIFFLSG